MVLIYLIGLTIDWNSLGYKEESFRCILLLWMNSLFEFKVKFMGWVEVVVGFGVDLS